MRTQTAHVTAFGRALATERRARKVNRATFADACGVTLSALSQWEYHRRGISSSRAAQLARQLGLPAWFFEQAIAEDRLASACRVSEVTAVVVGLELYVTARLPGEQWASVRAKLLEGM